MNTLLGPSISVSAWLADLPQKLQITFGFLVLVFFTIVEFPSSKQTRPLRLHLKEPAKQPATGVISITTQTASNNRKESPSRLITVLVPFSFRRRSSS
jgi:hypothetical protein